MRCKPLNIFKETDYRKIFSALVQDRKGGDRRWSFQGLAEAIRVPKSYVSRVMHGEADFNHDQLFLACEYFELTNDEFSYLDLLLTYERSGLEKRKAQLRKEIKLAQAKYLDLAKQLNNEPVINEVSIQSEYYLNPMFQLVHGALSIKKYQTNVFALCSSLAVTREYLSEILHRLERMGLCEQKEGIVTPIEVNFHLPKNSPIARAWLSQLRLLSMQRMQTLTRDDYFSYSVVFSGDSDTEAKIRQQFVDFLKTAQATVSDGVCERTFQLNLDLIPWA
jgi:transcriptional regulator with XRE-family HTH domain